MKPFKLEAKHMIRLNDTAFRKDISTRTMRELVKQPEAVMNAIQSTSLRFSLIPMERRAIRVG